MKINYIKMFDTIFVDFAKALIGAVLLVYLFTINKPIKNI